MIKYIWLGFGFLFAILTIAISIVEKEWQSLLCLWMVVMFANADIERLREELRDKSK